MKPCKILKELRYDISGATAVEYGLILALMFLAMVAAVQGVGSEVISTWEKVDSRVTESSAQARG